VSGRDAFWSAKQAGSTPAEATAADARGRPAFEPLELPRNTPVGFVIAFFAFIAGFALVWHIWVAAVAGIAGIAGIAMALLWQAWRTDRELPVTPAEIAEFEARRMSWRTPA